MDTKLKGRTAVRIICFVLITVLCFLAINRALATLVRVQNTGVPLDIILSDISKNDYFYEKNMDTVKYHASIVAYFGSEESIMSKMHLKWFDLNEPLHYDGKGGFVEGVIRCVLMTPDSEYYYGELPGVYYRHVPPELRLAYEVDAISRQLMQFRNSLNALDNFDGLYYFIDVTLPVIPDDINRIILSPFYDPDSGNEIIDRMFGGNTIARDEYIREFFGMNVQVDGEGNFELGEYFTSNFGEQRIVYSNIPEYEQEDWFFLSHPVYYIKNADSPVERSSVTDSSGYSWTPVSSIPGSISLAFSDYAVHFQNVLNHTVRNWYIFDLSIIAASVICSIFMVVVLLVGAGRQSVMINGVKTKSEEIHFLPVDKPYLDLSLAFIAGWTVVILFFCFRITGALWEYHLSLPATNVVFAVATILIVPLVLLWLMSLVKRIKAGQFWKHTLIYAVLYICLFGFLRFLVNKAISLWAGTRLTFKVAIISFAAFCTMFFAGVIGAQSRAAPVIFLFCVIAIIPVAILLLLYARRIRSLEQGARRAGEGNYGDPIKAGSGELGSIAQSINNISAGINTAVEERMKSERLKTELITNVSHDIRTPLTSIITYTDLLDHEGLDCERAPEYLDVLKQKSLRLKTLTDELFEAAKAATGNIDVNLTDLNIVSLINQVFGELDNAVKASGLDIRLNLPEKLIARADGRLMQRIMENLLSNVFKYSQPGSRVYMSAMQTDPASARIEIKNISSQELNFDPSELTERFKRGDDSRADGGSGLGLSIVQSFVNAQGGKFDIAIDGDLFKAAVTLPVSPPSIVIKD